MRGDDPELSKPVTEEIATEFPACAGMILLAYERHATLIQASSPHARG